MPVFRVQDARGRGPFAPGASRLWASERFEGAALPLPTWMQEFGADLLDRHGRAGEFHGCVVRKYSDLGLWFAPAEQSRLARLGYGIVRVLKPYRVIAEGIHQAVVGRPVPFTSRVVWIAWPHDGVFR